MQNVNKIREIAERLQKMTTRDVEKSLDRTLLLLHAVGEMLEEIAGVLEKYDQGRTDTDGRDEG
jgi:hypothetical protein